MLLRQETHANPLVERLLKEIQTENGRFERELRAVKREKIVLPVNISWDGQESRSAFTRDLSVAGTCIVTNFEVTQGQVASIEIYRLKDGFSRVVAEARWCKPFGNEYWVSGWQFVRISHR